MAEGSDGKPLDLIVRNGTLVIPGVGRVKAQTMSEEELCELEDAACPGCGTTTCVFMAMRLPPSSGL